MIRYYLAAVVLALPCSVDAASYQLECRATGSNDVQNLTVVPDEKSMVYNGIKLKVAFSNESWIVGSNAETVGTDIKELIVVSLGKKTGVFWVSVFPAKDGMANSGGNCFSRIYG